VDTKQEANREMSPELAKISALFTGQPKPKSMYFILHTFNRLHIYDLYMLKVKIKFILCLIG